METTIILGAGASKHYGFPTGAELITNIIEYCRETNSNPNDLTYSDLAREIEHFGNVLEQYAPTSIDAFLNLHSKNQDFIELGKRLISAQIIKYHIPDMMTARNKENWYKFLYDYLSENNFQRIFNDDVKIITFNYDLSLEFFFERRLELDPNISPEIRIEYMKRFSQKILHFYGMVYDYKDPPKVRVHYDDASSRYYNINRYCKEGHDSLMNILRDTPSKIRVIGEEREISNDPYYKIFLDYLFHCRRVFILGFGFDDTNLDLLGLRRKRKSTQSERKLFYTNFGVRKIIIDKADSCDFHTRQFSGANVYDALMNDFHF